MLPQVIKLFSKNKLNFEHYNALTYQPSTQLIPDDTSDFINSIRNFIYK